MNTDPLRLLAAMALGLAWVGWTARVWWRNRAVQPDAMEERAGAAERPSAVLMPYASQTGLAAALAHEAAARLRAAGVAVTVLPLSAVDTARLRATSFLLIVASTTGEGDPPDNAAAFVARTLPAVPGLSLTGLRYGVLALGDRHYRRFCGFGRALDQALAASGAQRLFDRIDVDQGDPQALAAWRSALDRLAPGRLAPPESESEPSIVRWQLAARTHLNPGSPGEPLYHLVFEPLGPMPAWRAGDIARIVLEETEPDAPAQDLVDAQTAGSSGATGPQVWPAAGSVRPAGDVLAGAGDVRDYSLASLPSEGRAELLVRLHRRSDGGLGRGSGWLTRQLPLGASIRLDVRANPACHVPEARLPLILVGSGSGLAGLRAQLKARGETLGRQPSACGPAWLLFGERSPAHDRPFADEIDAWLAQGVLQRADHAYSRPADGRPGRHVQSLLVQHAAELRDWLDAGALLYVCGSRQRLGEGVEQALLQLLGDEAVLALREAGRYRRDVY